MVLKVLLDCGLKKGYFQIKHISKIEEKSWKALKPLVETLKLNAIDFDETKEIWCKERKCDHLKSCDALIISPKKQRIDFIEFKNINIDKPKPKENTAIGKINNYKIEDKINHSIHILHDISNITCNLISNTKHNHRYYKIPIYVGVVMNINFNDGLHGLSDALNFLSESSSKYIINYDEETTLEIEKNIKNIEKKCGYKVEVFPINLENMDNHYQGLIDDDIYFR